MKTREELAAAVRGYWRARALIAAHEVGIFRALGRRSFTAATIARRVRASDRGIGLVLDALVGQGVLSKRGSAYAIAPAVLPFLTDGPESALGMLDHHANLWRLWDRLPEAIRTGSGPASPPGFRAGPEEARIFTRAMRDGAVRFAAAVAAEIPLGASRRLADLGGGPGVHAVELCRRYPGLEVVVMDLPAVAAAGREIVAEARDVAGRVRYHEGDIDRDALPERIDAALLSHVIHGKGEKGVRRVFRRVADALPAGGRFVVRDFFLAPDRATPAAASLFSLNMLVATPNGRSYTAAEATEWLREAGFASVRFRRSKAAPDTGYLLARR